MLLVNFLLLIVNAFTPMVWCVLIVCFTILLLACILSPRGGRMLLHIIEACLRSSTHSLHDMNFDERNTPEQGDRGYHGYENRQASEPKVGSRKQQGGEAKQIEGSGYYYKRRCVPENQFQRVQRKQFVSEKQLQRTRRKRQEYVDDK